MTYLQLIVILWFRWGFTPWNLISSLFPNSAGTKLQKRRQKSMLQHADTNGMTNFWLKRSGNCHSSLPVLYKTSAITLPLNDGRCSTSSCNSPVAQAFVRPHPDYPYGRWHSTVSCWHNVERRFWKWRVQIWEIKMLFF